MCIHFLHNYMDRDIPRSHSPTGNKCHKPFSQIQADLRAYNQSLRLGKIEKNKCESKSL